MGKYINTFNEKLNITAKSTYHREQYQTFMTGPEWRNVEMAEEYAAYLKDGQSMFKFPYFSQVFDLWKVVYQSFKAAKKYDSKSKIMRSEYGMMDLFIGFFTTAELLPKGFLSLFFRPFINSENRTEVQNHIADYYSKYAADLQTVPFYDQDYAAIKKELRDKYKNAGSKTWADWLSWKFVSAELTARHYISKPLSYWFHQEDNLVPATTDIIAKFNAENIEDMEAAKEIFQTQLDNLNASSKPTIVNEVYAKPNPEKNYTSLYAQLRAPRYASFQSTLKEMADKGIYIRKIAGQDKVQVKCVVEAENVAVLNEKTNNLKKVNNTKFLYSYGDRIHDNRKICLFDVPVKNLHETVNDLNAEEGTRVRFIHNF